MANDSSKFEAAGAAPLSDAEGAGGRSFPSGWWILPALVIGILLWALVLGAAADALLNLWWD